MILDVLKLFIPTTTAFFVGILLTPFLTHYLYKHKMWKKKAGKTDLDGKDTPIFNGLHKDKEVGTPRMGGIIIWASVLVTVLIFYFLAVFLPGETTTKFNFLSRNQTWLPLFTLLVASIIGLIDDLMQIRGTDKLIPGGLSFSKRLLMVVGIGLIGGWWFFDRLDFTTLNIPFGGELFLGIWIIPVFIFVMIALFSSSVIDGLDGLAGGILAIIFASYSVIAFFQNKIDLATFCAVLTGAILAFLWFNIPPARFYMSETGILGLTTTLTVIAFLTDSVFILPIIALPLIATSLSVIIQLTSKRLRNGKKVLQVAPLHHHFEAIGWPAYKVVMRYWIISIIAAIIGLILVIIS